MHKRTKNILLGTAGLAAVLSPSIVASVQPDASIFGMVATATEVKELKDFSGKIDLDPKTKVVNGVGQAGYGANYRFQGVRFSFSLSGRYKEGDRIPITSDIPLGPNSDVFIDGKKVGVFRQTKVGSYPDLTPTEANVKRADYPDSIQVNYEILFDKGIEEFENPKLSFESFGNFVVNPKFVKQGGKVITHKVTVGDKTLEQKLLYDGYSEQQTQGRLRFSLPPAGSNGSEVIGRDWGLGMIQGHTGDTFKDGDVVTFDLSEDTGLAFKFRSGGTVGKSYELGTIKDEFSPKSFKVNRVNGLILDTEKPFKVTVLESTPKRIKLRVDQAGGPNVIGSLDASTSPGKESLLLQTLILDQSEKTIDYEKNQIKNVKLRMTSERDGKIVLEENINDVGRISGLKLSADAQKVKRGSVVVNLVDAETGDPIKESALVKTNVVTGEDYSVDPNSYKILGYTYKGLRNGSAGLTGTVIEGTQTVVLEFVKDAEKPEDEEIVTAFLEEGSGKKLKDPVKAEKEAEPGTIEGYQFVRTERKGKEVTHWFKKKEEPKKPETKQPNTRYVDEDGRTIEEVPGSQDKKEIPGYTYLRTEKDKDGNTLHIYHKIVTRFVTDKGMTLKQVDGSQPKEEIDGYEFVETKTDEKTGDVTHVYREVTPTAEPFTILKDDKGNVLKTTKGTHDPEDLPGYRYLRTEKDKDGNSVHIYHRIVTSFLTTKDGKEEVLKTKDGVQPKEEIDGYEFVETKTDEKLGDIKHFYKVKVVAGAEKKAPVQTGGSAGMMILPAAAVLGLGGLVAGLARRKKD